MEIHKQKAPTYDDTIRLAHRCCSSSELRLLEKAYLLAEQAHSGSFRASGEPYITHPLAVSTILAEARQNTPTLIAALLHDVVEDTPVSLEEIQESFGAMVARIVDGVTIPTAPKSGVGVESLDDNRSGNYAPWAYQNRVFKLKRAIAAEPRTALVKLADVLHNLRTLQYLPTLRRQRYARQALSIYLPLAQSFMPQIVGELALLSWRNLQAIR
jgi:GTP pyrophosphokinase